MNVLVIVFTILMLLSIMTYNRLQTYITFSGIQAAYQDYMKEDERKYSNELEKRHYATARVKVAKAKGEEVAEEEEYDDEEEEEPAYTVPGQPIQSKPVRKLNLQPMLKGAQGGTENSLTAPTILLFARLIEQIYASQPFYKEAIAQNPELLNQIVATVAAIKGNPVCDAPVTVLKDLVKVSFPTDSARSAFGKMLDGGGDIPRLGDYIVIRQQSTPIRMMGASDELLRAIYRDPNIVEAFKNRRLDLSLAVRSKRMKADEAKKALTSEFGGDQYLDIIPRMLDFTVATTQPGK